MEVRRLSQHETADFRALLEIFRVVFENDTGIPGDEHLRKLLSDPGFMVFVVRLSGTVVGGLTIHILHQYYSVRPLAYIYDVGIATAFQGQGFGKALMAEACAYCKENGFEEAYVEAESNDIDAVHFYRKTSFSYETEARHFTYTFRNESGNNTDQDDFAGSEKITRRESE